MFSKRRLKIKNKKIISYTGRINLTCLDCNAKHEHCSMFYKLYKQTMTLYSVDELHPQTEHLFDFIKLKNSDFQNLFSLAFTLEKTGEYETYDSDYIGYKLFEIHTPYVLCLNCANYDKCKAKDKFKNFDGKDILISDKSNFVKYMLNLRCKGKFFITCEQYAGRNIDPFIKIKRAKEFYPNKVDEEKKYALSVLKSHIVFPADDSYNKYPWDKDIGKKCINARNNMDDAIELYRKLFDERIQILSTLLSNKKFEEETKVSDQCIKITIQCDSCANKNICKYAATIERLKDIRLRDSLAIFKDVAEISDEAKESDFITFHAICKAYRTNYNLIPTDCNNQVTVIPLKNQNDPNSSGYPCNPDTFKYGCNHSTTVACNNSQKPMTVTCKQDVQQTPTINHQINHKPSIDRNFFLSFVADKNDLMEELESLHISIDDLEECKCPVCESKLLVSKDAKDKYYQCRNCHGIFINGNHVVDSDDMQQQTLDEPDFCP